MVTHDFFFFQAEDGIRDYKVTGVQTCALPISRPRAGDGRALPDVRAPEGLAELRLPVAPRAGARGGGLAVRGRAPGGARRARGLGGADERRLARRPSGRAERRAVGRGGGGVGSLHATQVPPLRALLPVSSAAPRGRGGRGRREPPSARE